MTSRTTDTKQEVFSLAWSTVPRIETSAHEKAFAYYWSSLPSPEAQAKENAYSYSWSTPDPESSPAETRPDGAETQVPGPAGGAETKSPESLPAALHNISNKILGESFPSFRSIGVLGWSAIAGSGAVVALADSGPTVAIQLGSIGGLWLGVTAAIWFLPKFMR